MLQRHSLGAPVHQLVQRLDHRRIDQRDQRQTAPVHPGHVSGQGFGAPMPRRSWLRDTRALVEGEALSPFVRAALAADFASPVANSGSHGLDHINADLTLHLGRLPEGDWIGIERSPLPPWRLSIAFDLMGTPGSGDGGGV